VSPGTLTFTGDLTLEATSKLLIELAGHTQGSEYDFLSVAGNATLGGELEVTFLDGFAAGVQPTDMFTVLTSSGSSGISLAFANAGNGQRLFTVDGLGSFQVNYGLASAFAANSLVLSNFEAIPEPSTWILIGFGGVLLAILRFRRRF
jgi:hypothetical protein